MDGEVTCHSLVNIVWRVGGQNDEWWGSRFFLYICFIDKQAREKQHRPACRQENKQT